MGSGHFIVGFVAKRDHLGSGANREPLVRLGFAIVNNNLGELSGHGTFHDLRLIE